MKLKEFVAKRGEQMLVTQNGFVYAYADALSLGANNICTLAFFRGNRKRFAKAGWEIAPGIEMM